MKKIAVSILLTAFCTHSAIAQLLPFQAQQILDANQQQSQQQSFPQQAPVSVNNIDPSLGNQGFRQPGFDNNNNFSNQFQQPGNNLNPQGQFNRQNQFNGLGNNAMLQRMEKLTPSAFQLFVEQNTGKSLPRFGDVISARGTFAPPDNAPVPSTYSIGPGDEVLVRIWGTLDVNYRSTVDPEGQLSIPKVGTFPVAGVQASELNSFLTSQVGKYFKNFNLSATTGKLRGIQVYVVGQAQAPGLYTVSSLSTLATSVFNVAKPGPNGSFRHITLKRNGQVVSRFDLYNFINGGDLSADRKLLAGDVIVIEPVGKQLAVLGAVETPSVLEIKDGEKLGDLLKLVGAQGALTQKKDIQIESLDSTSTSPRSTLKLPFDKALSTYQPKDGDLVTLFSTEQQFANAVTLRGNVARPLRYPHQTGMKVSDLIPSEAALITPDYYKKQGRLVQFETDRVKSGQSVNLDRLDNQDAKQMLEGKPTRQQDRNKNVNRLEEDELNTSQITEINWDYAVIERLDTKNIRTLLIPFSLRKAISKDPKSDMELQPGDVVTVFSITDANVPKDKRTVTVKITGEVEAPGFYQMAPGETLQQLVLKAGGLTRNAYVFGSKLTRQRLKIEQQAQLDKAIQEAEKLLASAQRTNLGKLEQGDIRAASEQAQQQRNMLDKAKNLSAEGRLIMNIPEEATSPFDFPTLELENGDELTVPALPTQVSVAGSVFNQGSFVFKPGKNTAFYLEQAGGSTKTADRASMFLVRANGQVLSAQQYSWYSPFSLTSTRALPGDVLYVPEDYEFRLGTLRTVVQISQILYQLGLGAAAVQSIRN